MKVQFDSTILGGLPVSVVACIQPAEPDVGLMDAYVEEVELYWRGRRRTGLPAAVVARIGSGDMIRLNERAMEAAWSR